MQVTTESTLQRRLRRPCLAFFLAAAAIAALAGETVHAQNLDEGKSAPRIFADSCTTCHRIPRGLAKGRFRVTLYLFLQQHYASNSSSAWALASYLESIDGPQRRPSHAGTEKPSPSRSPMSRFSLRPPMPVPNH